MNTFNNNFIYSGNVTLKVKDIKSKKIIETRHIKNAGTKNLFKFLCDCLTGTFIANNRPRYLDGSASKYSFNEEYRAQGASLKCPSCGSSIVFDPTTKQFSCDACGSAFSKEEIERKTLSLKEDEEVFDEVIKEYSCPSCGAEIVTDENTTTEFCA